MAYLNKVMLIGNLGKDPEIRMSQQGGRKSVRFSIATTKRYRDNNGETKEQTAWHTVVGWGKVADTIEMLHVQKGTTLYVEGELTNRSWNDSQGVKHYSTEVSMASFQLLTPRNQSGSFGGNNGNSAPAYDYSQPYNQSKQQAQAPEQGYASGEDDDLPF